MIVLAYSHRDSVAAERLLKWMAFLSLRNDGDLYQERLLLVPSRAVSRLDRHHEIVRFAPTVFGRSYCYVPETELEDGWPESPNFMFRQALIHVEAHFPGEPIFWCEPDMVPITPDWYAKLEDEYQACGRPFMGGYVKHNIPHMTGIAWYPPSWRKLAPSLIQADEMAWDTYSAPDVMPRAHFTKLIQHVFHKPIINGLSLLRPEAVLFHQDKKHTLIHLLDSDRYGKEFFGGKDDVIEPIVTTMKYYHAKNSGRKITSMGLSFTFNSYEQFGMSWRGVYSTESEEEQIALGALTDDPATGISEITAEQYEAALKKKQPKRGVSIVASPTKSLLSATVAEKSGSVKPAEKAPAKPAADIPQSPAALPGGIDDALTLTPVQPLDPIVKPPKPQTRRKTKKG